MLIGSVEVQRINGVIRWTSGLAIDCDGAPTAYAPHGSDLLALDYLANAGSIGHWFGLVCNSAGVPYVQQAGDPAPGFYVSSTALVDSRYPKQDPRRYVDASTVPYIAIPPGLRGLGAQLGDVALVTYGPSSSPAIVADIGPRSKIGEGSPALASMLGIHPSAKNGGVADGVSFLLFAGTARGWPRTLEDVAAQVGRLGPLAVV